MQDTSTPPPTPKDPKAVAISMEELETAGAKSKSQIIRYLDSLGYERSAIAKFLGIKYQHVRNVLTSPEKRKIKAEREAQRLAGKHPSTLTPRQQMLVAGAPTTPIQPEEPIEDGEEDEEDPGGWISPALRPPEVKTKGQTRRKK